MVGDEGAAARRLSGRAAAGPRSAAPVVPTVAMGLISPILRYAGTGTACKQRHSEQRRDNRKRLGSESGHRADVALARPHFNAPGFTSSPAHLCNGLRSPRRHGQARKFSQPPPVCQPLGWLGSNVLQPLAASTSRVMATKTKERTLLMPSTMALAYSGFNKPDFTSSLTLASWSFI